MCFVYAEDAGMLARASMQAALSGKGRLQIVRRIAEATNAAKQAPTMRAKAVKSDTSLLALPDVQHSINGALKVGDKSELTCSQLFLDVMSDAVAAICWFSSLNSSSTCAGILMYYMLPLHARVSAQNAIRQ